jgi:hypothetical protein
MQTLAATCRPQHLRTGWTVAVLLLMVESAGAYVPGSAWSATASGTTNGEGNPVTLTWSIVPDVTPIPGEGGSDLISYLDGEFNVQSGGSDLTTRPWFTLFQQSFDRWSELGGITFVYQPNDTGATLRDSAGVLGVRGDVRIGGTPVDGPGGTLAFSWLPDIGDIVFDTGETNFFSNSANDYRGLRNTLMHEVGHAFGLSHVESNTEVFLMEPFINTSIDGPQLDDVRGIQGLYGDAYEKANGGFGNGTFARATSLGALAPGGSVSIGSDAAGGQAVSASETDFVSVAKSTDVDFFSFTVSTPSFVDVSLTPQGGSFIQGVEGGPQSLFDASARSDLALAVFDTNGTTLLGSANLTPAGQPESLFDLSLPSAGQYYVRVTGSTVNVQPYQLELSTVALAVLLDGDYNQDGVVDAADYTVWRDTLGQQGVGRVADGNGNDAVDEGDYTVWKNNFGEASGGGAAAITVVAEPSCLAVGMLSWLVGGAFSGKRLRHRDGRRQNSTAVSGMCHWS